MSLSDDARTFADLNSLYAEVDKFNMQTLQEMYLEGLLTDEEYTDLTTNPLEKTTTYHG